MINYIDLSRSEEIKLPYLDNIEFKDAFDGKGWSFSHVYHFTELRDIYLAIKQIGYFGIKEFTLKCLNDLHLLPYNTPWDQEGRRILEQVNALRNFGLLNAEYKIVDSNVFSSSEIGSDITDAEKQVFKRIYFNYFRFREMMSWLLDPMEGDRDSLIKTITEQAMQSLSHVVYPFARRSKFTNSFIFTLKSSAPIFYLSNTAAESNGGIIRFWDVFVKWGQELDVIEKFNLKNLDYKFADDYQPPSCVFFKREIDASFDLLLYIQNNYHSNYINIPKLIFKISTEFRYPVEQTKKMVVEQCLSNSEKFALQRTSEIFIRHTEINFVPVVNSSYVSHILLH